MTKPIFVALIGLMAVASLPVYADLIFVGEVTLTGSGFGALPRALTIQSHGPGQNVESGCIAPNGSGGLIAGNGACAPLDGDLGGDEQNPIGFPKQSAPTLSSLGITNAHKIGILFDAVQPQNANNNVVTINDLTLKLYHGATLVLTASGTFPNLLTNPGNGKTDYLFMLNDAEAAEFNAAIGGDFEDRIALDSTISFDRQSAGPDSYAFVNTDTIPGFAGTAVPETTTTVLIGSGLLGFGLLKMRSNGRTRSIEKNEIVSS